MKLLAILASTAAAAHQSVSTLSHDERAQLRADLAEWRDTFGADAAARGLLPPAHESMNPFEAEDDMLERFFNNNLAIEDARRNNPDAKFDNKHPYALMTPEEFKKHVVGLSFKEGEKSLRSLPVDELESNASLEASVDWTTGKCVNPIHNQGNCGSCWAFASLGAAESAHCIATGELLDLSEQQVNSCSTNGGSQGCNGGFPSAAINYIASTGVCLEKDYPYKSGSSGQTGSCQNSCTKKKLSIGSSVQTSGEANLATALNTQPVSVIVEAGNSVWQNYRGGVVSQCPGSQSDHAVIAVGYDGESYKIRNSWGTGWGESGHMRLKRGKGGKGTCNVVEGVSYPKITSAPTSSPSPTTKPTTAKPSVKPTSRPGCGTCSRCYYPAADMCLDADYTQDDCDYYNADYGTVWCGN